MIAYVFQKKRKRDQPHIKVVYHARYKLAWMNKVAEVTLETTDKRVAEQRLAQIVKELEHEQAGLIAPRTIREGVQRPLLEHLADFVADMKARGLDSMYIYNIEKRVTKLAKSCGWVTPRDVTPDTFTLWRGKQKLAPKTLNHYLAAVSTFFHWMKEQKRVNDNPLSGVSKVETRGRERLKRRAYSDEEVLALKAVAGPRWVAYMTALLTGLRRDEMRQLQWGDLVLDTPKPFVKVRASTTKNHKPATLRIRADLAAELLKIRPLDVSPTRPVFGKKLPRMDALCADLKAARIRRVDERGRVLDFHAFRKTFNTNLKRAGVTPAVNMMMMRVSDHRLIDDVYMDTEQISMADEVEKLPRFEGPRVETRPAVAAQIGMATPSKIGPHNSFAESDSESSSVVEGDASENTNRPVFQGESDDLSGCVAVGGDEEKSWGTRIRT